MVLTLINDSLWHWVVGCFRSPYLYTISIGIPIYVGLLTLFVIANFGLATFMDPGIYPKGNHRSMLLLLFIWYQSLQLNVMHRGFITSDIDLGSRENISLFRPTHLTTPGFFSWSVKVVEKAILYSYKLKFMFKLPCYFKALWNPWSNMHLIAMIGVWNWKHLSIKFTIWKHNDMFEKKISSCCLFGFNFNNDSN